MTRPQRGASRVSTCPPVFIIAPFSWLSKPPFRNSLTRMSGGREEWRKGRRRRRRRRQIPVEQHHHSSSVGFTGRRQRHEHTHTRILWLSTPRKSGFSHIRKFSQHAFLPTRFFLADSRMKRWGKLLVSPVGRHWRVIEQLVGLRRGFSVSVQRNGEILDCSFDRDNLQFVYWNSSSPLGLAPTKRWEEGKQQTDKRPGSQVYNVDIGRGHAGITRIRCVDAFFLCSFWARPM